MFLTYKIHKMKSEKFLISKMSQNEVRDDSNNHNVIK